MKPRHRHLGSPKHPLAIALLKRIDCVVRAQLGVGSGAVAGSAQLGARDQKPLLGADNITNNIKECINVRVAATERGRKIRRSTERERERERERLSMQLWPDYS